MSQGGKGLGMKKGLGFCGDRSRYSGHGIRIVGEGLNLKRDLGIMGKWLRWEKSVWRWVRPM